MGWNRRGDRPLEDYDRLCSCHFKDGLKDNTPTIFKWNTTKIFDYPDPPRLKTNKRRVTGETELPASSESGHNFLREEHSYAYSCPVNTCTPVLQSLVEAQQQLKDEVAKLTKDLEHFTVLAEKKKPMTVSSIQDEPEKMLLYTSLSTDVFYILLRAIQRFNLNYFCGWRVSTIPLEDQLLMTLIKLRLNLRDLDLAERFCTSRTTVSNVVKTLICALHELLVKGILAQGIPSQAKCQGSMPKSFNDFISTRIVMDATEITQDIPHELNNQARSYSNYKSRHTVKAVTCVAPNAALVFCSKLYPGSVSDVAIVEDSKILEQLVPGDLILADKGFNMYSKLPPEVSLNIPPFLAGKGKFTKEEAKLCAKIARARIHVERANERIKNFEILNHIPANLRPFSTKILQLCCCLVNLQAPLLVEIAEDYSCV